MKALSSILFHAIHGIEKRIITIRQDLHAHPELSGGEERTKYFLKGILEAEGIEVHESDHHFGLIAQIIIDPDKPFIALRADMDALPITELNSLPYISRNEGIMHACGHDAHTAIVLGTAIALNQIKNHLKNNIRFIFQPSEEILEGGSSQMIEEGALENVKAIFGLHAYPYLPTGQIGYKKGVMLASTDMFEIEIFGRSSHAARPHEGVDAILVTAMAVNSLNHIVSRQIDPLHPAVISLGTIEGGRAANVICDHVKLQGTVRTVNHDVRRRIPEMMEVSIAGICKSMHADYQFHYNFGIPELLNDDAMVEQVIEASSTVIGKENCIDLIDPVMGGEDFGRYLETVPGAFFRLGTCNKAKETCIAQHNSRFNVDDDALSIGMKILGLLALKEI
ncbi:MAG: amidohydrolase [Sulfuricurvum sp.]|nr:amidohydrolase [Sulfuricurvum sp.]